MENTEIKAYWCSLMDSDTETEFYGGGYPFFGTDEELEQHIDITERGESEIHECNVAVIVSDYTLEEIASDIMRQRLYYTYILPSDYCSLDVASDLFHMYDVWVDTDFCARILPHLKAQMNEKKAKRDAELTAYYGGIPSKCDKYGNVTL